MEKAHCEFCQVLCPKSGGRRMQLAEGEFKQFGAQSLP